MARASKLPKVLVALVVAALGILIIQMSWERKTNFSAPAATLTDTLKNDFILQIPQKALWNSYIVVTAEATPGVTCSLLYIPPSGDSQEMSSTADKNGHCVWRWKIDPSQGKGNGRLIITINGRSETHFFEIRSSF